MTDAGPPADPRVRLVARTEFINPSGVGFATDTDGAEALTEFAGRACYQSWDKPRPATATNAGYLRHVIEVGHLSLLEHAAATFYLTGISRSAAHEIVRHRHLSCTERSPRYSGPDQGRVIEPPAVAADPAALGAFRTAAAGAVQGRSDLLDLLPGADSPAADRLTGKQVRSVAQTLLPGATETAMVVSGNYRSWRHFIGVRGTDPADLEVRALAVAVLRILQVEAPHVFADFRISALADGSETAASPLIGEG